MTTKNSLIVGGAIVVAGLMVAGAVLSTRAAQRYEIEVQSGGVLRHDRWTGEVVLCGGVPGEGLRCVQVMAPAK